MSKIDVSQATVTSSDRDVFLAAKNGETVEITGVGNGTATLTVDINHTEYSLEVTVNGGGGGGGPIVREMNMLLGWEFNADEGTTNLESSDETVVSICEDNGAYFYKAVKAGTATITRTYTANNEVCTEDTNITVKAFEYRVNVTSTRAILPGGMNRFPYYVEKVSAVWNEQYNEYNYPSERVNNATVAFSVFQGATVTYDESSFTLEAANDVSGGISVKPVVTIENVEHELDNIWIRVGSYAEITSSNLNDLNTDLAVGEEQIIEIVVKEYTTAHPEGQVITEGVTFNWNTHGSSALTVTQIENTTNFKLTRVGTDSVDLELTIEYGDQQIHYSSYWFDEIYVSYSSSAMVGKYAIGFGSVNDDAVHVYSQGWHGPMGSTDSETPDTSKRYEAWDGISVVAGIPVLENGQIIGYSPAEEGAVDIAINKLTLTTLDNSNEDTFSLSSSGHVKEKTSGPFNEPFVYFKDTYTGHTQLTAELTVTVGQNAPVVVVVSVDYEIFLNHRETFNRPANDTTEDLNTFLAGLANTLYAYPYFDVTVNLAPKTYEGEINIPSIFDNRIEHAITLNGRKDGSSYTTICGGINLETVNVTPGGTFSNYSQVAVLEVSFVKPQVWTKAAVYGGSGDMFKCTFYGYDIALQGDHGSMVPQECVFLKNGTAVVVDYANAWNLSRQTWEYNTFIGNTTAVHIVSLNDFISPFWFRIVMSNFIGNTTDFDVDARGTYYEYRNYYGEDNEHKLTADTGRYLQDLLAATTVSQISGLAHRRLPQVSLSSGVTMIMNPRWKFPVGDKWHQNRLISDLATAFGNGSFGSASFSTTADTDNYITTNVLLADWNNETRIINDSSSQLAIDSSAFEEAGAKTIGVVEVTPDGSSSTDVGSWSFPEAASAGTASIAEFSITAASNDSFNAGIETAENSDETVSVTVNGSSVLSTYEPELTVVVDKTWEEAFVTDPAGAKIESTWDKTQKTITFTVAAGGTYKVREGDGSDYTPPTSGGAGAGAGAGDETDETDEPTVTTEKDKDGNTVTTTTWSDGKTAVEVETPEGDVTIKVTSPDGEVEAEITLPAEIPAADKKFKDVKDSDWFMKNVYDSVALGMIFGTTETTFSPKAAVSRGMLVSVLYRLSGKPKYGTGAHRFKDVPTSAYFCDASDWASSMGIASGTGKGFEPDKSVTRQDMVSMLYRFARSIGAIPEESASLTSFSDKDKVADYAQRSMEWAVGAKIIFGRDNNKLDPKGTLPRSELAAILVRFVKYLQK